MDRQPSASDPHRQQLLLAAARMGDRQALGRLLAEMRPYLVSRAGFELNGKLQEKADASDMVQDALLRACSKIGEFRGETVAEFRVWLDVIIQNEVKGALRYWRRLRRNVEREYRLESQEGSAAAAASRDASPSSQFGRKEAAARIMALIDRLPADERAAVKLRHFERWSIQQIACHLDRTPLAITSMLRRITLRLLARLRRPAEHPNHDERSKAV